MLAALHKEQNLLRPGRSLSAVPLLNLSMLICLFTPHPSFLSISVSVSLSLSVSVSVSIYLSLSPHANPFLCLNLCLSLAISISLPACLPPSLPLSLSLSLSTLSCSLVHSLLLPRSPSHPPSGHPSLPTVSPVTPSISQPPFGALPLHYTLNLIPSILSVSLLSGSPLDLDHPPLPFTFPRFPFFPHTQCGIAGATGLGRRLEPPWRGFSAA